MTNVITQVSGSASQLSVEHRPLSHWQRPQEWGHSDTVMLDSSARLHFHPLQYLNPVSPNCSLSPGFHWLFEAIPRNEAIREILKITVIKCKKLTTKSLLSILYSQYSIHLSNHSSELNCAESISLSNTYIRVAIFCSCFSKGQQREHTQESIPD